MTATATLQTDTCSCARRAGCGSALRVIHPLFKVVTARWDVHHAGGTPVDNLPCCGLQPPVINLANDPEAIIITRALARPSSTLARTCARRMVFDEIVRPFVGRLRKCNDVEERAARASEEPPRIPNATREGKRCRGAGIKTPTGTPMPAMLPPFKSLSH